MGYLAVTNVLLGIFNLLPAFPLDGGRILHAIVWKISGHARIATRVATFAGQVIASLLIVGGFFLLFGGALLDGVWLGLIGWFLLSGAQSASSQAMLEAAFKEVTVREVMNASPHTVPANLSLHKLVEELLLPYGWRSAFVVQGEVFAGLITLGDIRRIPRNEWAQTPVGFAMTPLERLHTITPQQSVNEVLPLMAGRDVNQLPVLEQDHMVGMVSRVRFLAIRRGLRLARRADEQS